MKQNGNTTPAFNSIKQFHLNNKSVVGSNASFVGWVSILRIESKKKMTSNLIKVFFNIYFTVAI